MYQPRVKKSEQAFKNVLLAHNPHNISLSQRNWPERINILFTDPGVSHFAMRIERRNIVRDEPIETLFFDKIGLSKEDQEPDEDNVTKIFTFIQDFLDKHKESFLTCHMILIEKQLPINYRAVRMSQHVLTYFMVLLKNKDPELPMFLEVAPTLKGRELGAGNLNEKGIKQWSVSKAIELLTIREDKKGLEVMNRKIKGKKEKKDDLADCVTSIESVCSIFGWPLTKPLTVITLNIPKIIKSDKTENKVENKIENKPKLVLVNK